MASGTAKYPYKTDAGNIFFARTDDSPALAAIRGTIQGSFSITESITFKVSKTSKEVGCQPRHVTLYLKTADSTNGCLINPKNVVKKVVVMSPDTVVLPNQEVTVNGRTWITGSITPEQMR
jgi:hypothetical protein